ncbi:sigma-54-dependent transcriptional regulator [Ideonella livida]|uniref:Sigma-54-dependent Fis family transcriptional regulator n=1 Tax=Ideonella livida TaxID=2707176 RepID=A0A7C9TID8_9BURK|nr:sigma-54 dependent transcriptional regulator [Ideonella livida]NDY90183.1 sigma-54-dependent Fis family transcriptional regulator [Ideonella livida]
MPAADPALPATPLVPGCPPPPLEVLLVEDDPDVRRTCAQALRLEDLPVVAVADAEAALALLAADPARCWGAVVSDVRLPGQDGMAVLRGLQVQAPGLPVILMTGHGDIAMAVQAMRDGAYDFLEKPFSGDRLADVVRRALDKRRLLLENQALRERLAQVSQQTQDGPALVGQAPAMRALRRHIQALAPLDVEVLLYGETGTGKEEVARALHQASGRRGPFVALNCGALPESVFESEVFGHESGAFTGAARRRIGKIEHAQGGTLFLDEIESMPLALQVKLLRVLQQGVLERLGGNQPVAVDCRIVAASKVDLKAWSDEGRFRADLYYRLHVACLPLPPLRQRREDIPLLMAHFLAQAAARYHLAAVPGWTPAQMARWQAQDWPGNVRELKNTAHRLCLGLEPEAEPPAPGPGVGVGEGTAPSPLVPWTGDGLARTLEQVERQLIEAALTACAGQVAAAAERLQLPRKTLYDKMARLGIATRRA